MANSLDALHLSSFFPNTTTITKIVNSSDRVEIYLKSNTHHQHCPICGKEANKYHSTYKRKLQDLPILGKTTYIFLTAYQYECDNCKCNQKVFCENPDDFSGHYKRMTRRLENFLTTLALNTNCEGAARISNLLGIKVSGDTIIRMLIERASHLSKTNTDFIGVDDWAYRKGQTYGTIIVDGNTHKPIELLDGRDGSGLKQWLLNNKQVKIITRDRASAYASAIEEILPEAMQIADRFHLHQNLLECINKVMQQNIPNKIKIEDEQDGSKEKLIDVPKKKRENTKQNQFD